MNRAELFSAVARIVPGIWAMPGAIKEMDDLADIALAPRIVPDAPRANEQDATPRKVSAAGLALIHEFEGCHKPIGGGQFQAYPDPGTGGKPWTIGWGSTRDFDGKPIVPGTVWTKEQCDRKSAEDMEEFERRVVKALGSSLAATSQQQFDAMVSFDYNTGAIHRATLTKKHRAGDHAGAAREFGRWNKAGGRVMRGLTRRRAAEAKLYRSGS